MNARDGWRSSGDPGWKDRGRPRRDAATDIERINEIANDLTVAALALSAGDDESAGRAIDEALARARRELSDAVADARSRARRRRAGAWAAGLTLTAAAAVGIGVLSPPTVPPSAPDTVATDERPLTADDLDRSPSDDLTAQALRRRTTRSLAADGTAASVTTVADAQRAREAVTARPLPEPAPPVSAGDHAPDPGITAASEADGTTAAATVDQPIVATAEEPAETHPGVLTSGRARPAEPARGDRPAHGRADGRPANAGGDPRPRGRA